jgi:hypothetical protein
LTILATHRIRFREAFSSLTRNNDAPVLGARALNRALLARQMLLLRAPLAVEEALERLVGMQAQIPNAPYVGLWTRLAPFDPRDLARLLEGRRVVRMPLMRTTIHLVTARDCARLRPLMRTVLERGFATRSPFGRNLDGLDLEPVLAAGRALMEERPRTTAELGTLLGARWPDRDAMSLAMAVRYLVAIVQVPPRGVWGATGRPKWTTADSWTGKPIPDGASLDELVLRYLGAFGPASVRDIQAWSWLTRLRDVVERLRPRLLAFRDENGRELFDLPDAPRPDPDTPAPPRLLPEFDNALLSHADRTRIIPNGYRERLFTRDPRGSFLVDGFARGTWKILREGGRAYLQIEPFVRLSKADSTALAEEARRLLAFVTGDDAGGARAGEVRFGTSNGISS